MTSSARPAATVSEKVRKSLELANLDLLRCIAVLCVFARHILAEYNDPNCVIFWPQALGILGVCIFFVHTSLVLMMSMDRHGRAERPPTGVGYASFMVRRIFRIYPLSIFTVLVSSFFLIPQDLYPFGAPVTGKLVASNLLLVQNLTHQPSVVLPLWSLPIEVQMYFFLPLFFQLVSKKGFKFVLYYIYPVAVILGFARLKLQFLPDIFTFAPCFLPGVIAFDVMRQKKEQKYPFWALPLLVGILGILYMSAVRAKGGQYLWSYPVCLTLGLLLGSFQEIPASFSGLANVAKVVAKYSFGIYLFHSIFIHLCYGHMPWLPSFLMLPLTIVLTGVASVAGYHLIEAPMVSAGSKVAKRFAVKAADERDHKIEVGEESPKPEADKVYEA